MAHRNVFSVTAALCLCLISIASRHLWINWNDYSTVEITLHSVLLAVLAAICYISFDLYLCSPDGASYSLKHQLGLYVIGKLMGYFFIHVLYKKFIKQTKNCKSTQEAYLLEHLRTNRNTVYGLKYRYADIKCRDDYVKSVPLIKQADIAPYCQRIARGEKNILTKEDPVMMALTTGTTGNNCPIPVIKSIQDKGYKSIHSVTTKCLMDLKLDDTKIRKDVYLMFSTKFGQTECGLTLAPLSYYSLRRTGMLGIFAVAPIAAFKEVTSRQDIVYLAMLFSIADKTAGVFMSSFAIAVVNAMRVVEENWKRMVDEIRTGQILSTGFTTDPRILADINKGFHANPARAEELELEFRKGFVGIMRRIWPNMKAITALTSGAMQLYAQKLKERYGKGLVIYSSLYGGTEGFGGVNLDPFKDEYVFVPDSSFYEFIAEEDMDKDQPVTLFAEQVEIGKTYELVLTNMNGLCRYRFGDVIRIEGFYNTTPKFTYQYRKGQLLNLLNEKTTEVSVLKTITSTVDRWSGCSLVDYTCALSIQAESITGDTTRPGPYYIFFLELDFHDRKEHFLTDQEKSMMDETLRSISQLYNLGRGKEIIKPIVVHLVAARTFVDLREHILEVTTASTAQFKMPRVLKRDTLVKFMLDKVIE